MEQSSRRVLENSFVISKLPDETSKEDVEAFIKYNFPHFNKIKARIHVPLEGKKVGNNVVKTLIAFVNVGSVEERDEVIEWYHSFPHGCLSVTNPENISSNIHISYQFTTAKRAPQNEDSAFVNTAHSHKYADYQKKDKLSSLLSAVKLEHDAWILERNGIISDIKMLEEKLKIKCPMFQSELDGDSEEKTIDALLEEIDVHRNKLVEVQKEFEDVKEGFSRL